jgi:hypothetical protein
MALDITAQLSAIGGGTVQDTVLQSTQPLNLGAGIMPVLATSYTYGTGSSQVNAFWAASRTVAATTYDNINLTTAPNALGTTFSLTKLKALVVAISSPDGSKKLRVGPQNQSNAAQLWFGGTGATAYDEFFHYRVWEDPYTGYAVTASTADILPIYNPTGSSITYAIWLLGLD